MTQSPPLLDQTARRRNRNRAAAAPDGSDFLFVEGADRLLDRLDDIRRPFPVALDVGCRWGEVAATLGGRGQVETLYQSDPSPKLCAVARRRAPHVPTFCADEDALPLPPESLDLVLSNLDFHGVGDLPGALGRLRGLLKPGGAVLISLLGAETLFELRDCLAEADVALFGQVFPRVCPTVGVKGLGDLAARAGFVDPTVDLDTLSVRYERPLTLLQDLRHMGEANAMSQRPRQGWTRTALSKTLEIYRDRFGGDDGDKKDGRVPATFQILTLTAWKPG